MGYYLLYLEIFPFYIPWCRSLSTHNLMNLRHKIQIGSIYLDNRHEEFYIFCIAMADQNEQRRAKFFEGVANIEDLRKLSQEDKEALVGEFSPIPGMSRLLTLLRSYVRNARDPGVQF